MMLSKTHINFCNTLIYKNNNNLQRIDLFDKHSQLFSKKRVFVTQSDIYRNMKKKTQHLSIRLTSGQYQKLIQVLKTERITKSELVRLALADYIKE